MCTQSRRENPRAGLDAKVKLAVKLRDQTTMTLKWIATRLQMEIGGSLSNLLSAQRWGKVIVSMWD